jgi:hypothetical protein
MQRLSPDVFRNFVMDHLGLADMLSIQYSCKHGHALVSAARSMFLTHLHAELRNQLTKQSGWYNLLKLFEAEKETRKNTEFALFGGSFLLKVVNREYWEPRDIDIFRVALRHTGDSREGCSLSYMHRRWATRHLDGYPHGFWSLSLAKPIPGAIKCNMVVDTVLLGFHTTLPLGSGLLTREWLETRFDLDFIKITYDGQTLFVANPMSIVYRTSHMSGPTTTNPNTSTFVRREQDRTQLYEKRGFKVFPRSDPVVRVQMRRL